jgi:hypothetical protein
MKRIFYVATMVLALAGAQTARADELSWSPSAVMVTAPGSGLYVFGDGSYQHIDLPNYSLGLEKISTSEEEYLGQVEGVRPSVDGGGFRGGLGYFLPPGGFLTLGMNQRIEIGGSYVRADGSGSASAAPTGALVAVSPLGGLAPHSALFCGYLGYSCAVSERLTTDYDNWHLEAKLATDYPVGPVTMTPSIAFFGGETSADQRLSQSFAQFSGGASVGTGLYNAKTSLDWTDIGVKLGLDAHIDVTPWLAVGAGGYVGVLDRTASLRGNDNGSSTPTFDFDATSSLQTGASTDSWVANAEAGLIIKPMPAVAIRLFVGMNYDAQVPGVQNPINEYLGTAYPARIMFRSEIGYYGGAGAIWRF